MLLRVVIFQFCLARISCVCCVCVCVSEFLSVLFVCAVRVPTRLTAFSACVLACLLLARSRSTLGELAIDLANAGARCTHRPPMPLAALCARATSLRCAFARATMNARARTHARKHAARAPLRAVASLAFRHRSSGRLVASQPASQGYACRVQALFSPGPKQQQHTDGRRCDQCRHAVALRARTSLRVRAVFNLRNRTSAATAVAGLATSSYRCRCLGSVVLFCTRARTRSHDRCKWTLSVLRTHCISWTRARVAPPRLASHK